MNPYVAQWLPADLRGSNGAMIHSPRRTGGPAPTPVEIGDDESDAPVEVCSHRDVKGLYAGQRAGSVSGLTGVDDPYEHPGDAELSVDTTTMTVPEAIDAVLAYLVENGWVEPKLG